MYDPKFTQKQMYDQYGRSRESNKKVDSKPSRGSGFSGMGADPAERFGGSPTKGLGSKPFEQGSTYDVIPTPPQRDDKPDPPTSIIDTVKNKAVELFKSFGGDDPKDTEVDPSKVYRGPMFRGPINPGVIETRIKDAVDYSKAPPLFYTAYGSTYDTVPPVTANKDRVKNAVNAFLKQRGIGGKEYTIKRGDTLSEIAQREGVAIDDLAKVNKIENINRILAGETLIIPPPQEMERAKDIVDSVDPDAQFYQSGVPLDQRTFEPELGYDEIPLPSEATVDKKIRGLGARPEVTVTELDATSDTADVNNPQTQEEMLDTDTLGDNVDFDFIAEQEGEAINNAYVPQNEDGNPEGQSGVTVGTGVDLGSKDRAYFDGLDEDLVEKLEPYFGQRRENAQTILAISPLTLTDAEVSELDQFVKDKELATLRTRWNQDSTTEWDDLPENQATAVASVFYQYGPKMFEHNYWTQTTSGDWTAARNNLRNYGDRYNSRRNREATYLESGEM